MSCISDVVVKSSSMCCGDMERIWWKEEEETEQKSKKGQKQKIETVGVKLELNQHRYDLLGWLLMKMAVVIELTLEQPLKMQKHIMEKMCGDFSLKE